MKEEKQFEIKLNDGKKVTIGLFFPIYENALAVGNFIKLEPNVSFPLRLVCAYLELGQPVILMFEADSNGIYRVVLDINLTADDVISIEKRMKDGSTRRTDVKICF